MVGTITWNAVNYMDAIDGMKSLASKSIDLGFADPPFNIALKDNVNSGKPFCKITNATFYDDAMDPDEYRAWCATWLREMKRVCRKVLVYCGAMNLSMFYKIDEPLDEIIYFMKFNTIITSTSWAGRHRPILVYVDDKNAFLGRPRGKNCKFDSSVIVKKRQWFDSSEEEDRKKLVHPCPIDRELVNSILVQMRPETFLDVFTGSGTAVMIAKELGIPFITFEKNKAYAPDHEYLLGKSRDRTAIMKPGKKFVQRTLV